MKRAFRSLLIAGVAAAMLCCSAAAAPAPQSPALEPVVSLDPAALWDSAAAHLVKDAAGQASDLDTDALWEEAAAQIAMEAGEDAQELDAMLEDMKAFMESAMKDGRIAVSDLKAMAGAAMAGKSYTILTKAADYAKQFAQGTWTAELSLRGTAVVNDEKLSVKLPISVDAEAVVQDGRPVKHTVNDGTDWTLLTDALPPECLEAMEQFREAVKDGADGLSLRDLKARPGAEDADWHAMLDEFSQRVKSGGLDITGDWRTTKEQLRDAMAEAKTKHEQVMGRAVSTLFASLADDNFVEDGGDYVCTLDWAKDGQSVRSTLTLHMQDDAVVGYSVSMNGRAGGEKGPVSVSMTLEQTAGGAVNGTYKAAAGSHGTLDLTLSGSCVKAPGT